MRLHFSFYLTEDDDAAGDKKTSPHGSLLTLPDYQLKWRC